MYRHDGPQYSIPGIVASGSHWNKSNKGTFTSLLTHLTEDKKFIDKCKWRVRIERMWDGVWKCTRNRIVFTIWMCFILLPSWELKSDLVIYCGLPQWLSYKESTSNAGVTGDSGPVCRSLKIPWRRKQQPTPIFLPGKTPWTEEPGGLQSMRWQSPTRLSDSALPWVIYLHGKNRMELELPIDCNKAIRSLPLFYFLRLADSSNQYLLKDWMNK